MMSDSLLRWCLDQLQYKFGLDAGEDIVKYILSIDNAEEIAEYVGDLLQGRDGLKKLFIEELVLRWQSTQSHSPDTTNTLLFKDTLAGDGDMMKESQKKSKRKGRNRQEFVATNPVEPEPEPVKTPIDLMKAQENSSSTTQKKKNKFVNLYAKEGQDKLAIMLPGRHACECLAQQHNLINNCITCGRIVCEQEGSGPCLFCGSLVCTREEQEILQRDSNKSQKLRKKLVGDMDRDYLPHQEARMNAGLEKALKHKDTLLEYDKNSVRRTQVLDDESDYFATDSNQWLSPVEREKLRKKEEELRELRHASRKDRKITLDFAGRQVLDEGQNLTHYYNKFDETVKSLTSGQSGGRGGRGGPKGGSLGCPEGGQVLRELLNPNIQQAAPQWVDIGGEGPQRKRGEGGLASRGAGPERSRLRLQDAELQEMSDGGWCLSMHQPWASLLVTGIKRVEGRTWYTPHRGRLWIAAAAKKPTPEEISEVENMYRHIYSKDPGFPKDYPTGCLLGCVNMTDCLSQDQYREKFPVTCEESSSPFVFICSHAQEMLVKFPMKGKHKIFKLESQYHQGAKRGLLPAAAV